MDLLHGSSRVIGYLLLVIGLPSFIMMFALFSSGLISSSVSQDISNAISSVTGNGLLAGLAGFFVSITGLFLLGAFAIIGAGLIFFGSKDYTGFSRVGTEVLILSVISLISAYVISDFAVPLISSHIGGSSGAGISSTVLTLLSPIFSNLVLLDIIFIIIGAVLVALRWLAPIILNKLSALLSKKKQNKSSTSNVTLYKNIGIPAGIVVSLLLLVVFTFMNSSLLASSVPTYSLTPASSNPVSLAYQNASSNPASLENLSDYYFLTGPNETVNSQGSVGLSLSGVPLQLSLPLNLSISKVGDPVSINFNINLSKFSGILSSISSMKNQSGQNSGISIPKDLTYNMLYNDSGLLICNNLNLSGSSSNGCTYQPIGENLNKVLLNVNSGNENLSILGLFFSLLEAPDTLIASNSGQTSNYAPTFQYVGNFNNYGDIGGQCSEFYVFADTSYTETDGYICISDTSGLPTYVSIAEAFKLNNETVALGISFVSTSVNTNITTLKNLGNQ